MSELFDEDSDSGMRLAYHLRKRRQWLPVEQGADMITEPSVPFL